MEDWEEKGEEMKFPPTPPSEMWQTKELEMSPLRKLVWRGEWRGLLPKFSLPSLRQEKRKPMERARKDLPTVEKDKKHKRPNLGAFLKAEKARRANHRGNTKFSIEKDFFANSSQGSKDSRKSTVRKMLRIGERQKVSLDVVKIKSLASILKNAGYKSGAVYLSEAKLMHVEEGGEWPPLMDRVYKLSSRALNRGKGPKKKAPEVDLVVRLRAAEQVSEQRGVVKFGRELFVFNMIWMLREVELVNFKSSDVVFNFPEKRVTLCWEVSKTDPSAEGVKRTLQCWCEGACYPECPFWVCLDLINKVEASGGTGAELALTVEDEVPKKAQIVDAWRKVYGVRVTGHSARRTGALSYIRDGWEGSQVAYLGRWKSGMILEYAKEALETMPVNRSKPSAMLMTASPKASEEETKEALEESRKLLQKRVADVKKDVTKAREELTIQIRKLEERSKFSGNLPKRVMSTNR